MGTIVVFAIALISLIILFTFKIVELKRGVKPFSVHRYKADAFFRKKAEVLGHYFRFVNFRTFKLLGLFLAIEGKSYVVSLSKNIKETKLALMVRGKHTPQGNGNGTTSNYLKRFADLKDSDDLLK